MHRNIKIVWPLGVVKVHNAVQVLVLRPRYIIVKSDDFVAASAQFTRYSFYHPARLCNFRDDTLRTTDVFAVPAADDDFHGIFPIFAHTAGASAASTRA